MIEVRDSAAVWQYFHAELGLHGSADFRGVCHVPEQFRDAPLSMDHVAAAVGYNAFIGRTCCMHTVIKRPELLTARMVRQAFEFPFVICNCEAVLGLVDSTNDAAMSFDLRLGFKEVHRIPNGGTEGDLVLLQMLRADCRWLRAH